MASPALFRPGISRASDRPVITHGVQSGDVSADGAVVWSRSDRPSRMIVEAATSDSFREIRQTIFADALPESDFTAKVLLDELRFQQALAGDGAYRTLPRGPVHGDLFRDNVLFIGGDASAGTIGEDKLSGFFDFYFAGTDVLIYDLAVCLNDWCTDRESGAPRPAMTTAFVEGYERMGTLTSQERHYLPAVLRAAALRFWLSRLMDLHFPRESALLQTHDPERFYRVLCHHRRASAS